MMKKKVCVSVDPDVWDLAKEKLNVSRSEFIEDQLQRAIGLKEDEEQQLLNKIAEKKNELNILESKLCAVRSRKFKDKKDNDHVNVDSAISTLTRIYDRLGAVGVNQIKNICKRNDVSFDVVYDILVSKGFRIVNFMEVPK